MNQLVKHLLITVVQMVLLLDISIIIHLLLVLVLYQEDLVLQTIHIEQQVVLVVVI